MNKLTIVMYHHVREIKNSKYPKIKELLKSPSNIQGIVQLLNNIHNSI